MPGGDGTGPLPVATGIVTAGLCSGAFEDASTVALVRVVAEDVAGGSAGAQPASVSRAAATAGRARFIFIVSTLNTPSCGERGGAFIRSYFAPVSHPVKSNATAPVSCGKFQRAIALVVARRARGGIFVESQTIDFFNLICRPASRNIFCVTIITPCLTPLSGSSHTS